MADQEEVQADARVDSVHHGRAAVTPIIDATVQNASATVNARESSFNYLDKIVEEPQPTYVPAALAMGIMMLLWGILTNWIMSAAGALVMVWAVTGWVREMHEREQPSEGNLKD